MIKLADWNTMNKYVNVFKSKNESPRHRECNQHKLNKRKKRRG